MLLGVGEKGGHLNLFQIFPDSLHVFMVQAYDLDNFKDPVKGSETKPSPSNINRRRVKMPQGCFRRQIGGWQEPWISGESRDFPKAQFLICKMGRGLMQSPGSWVG